MKQSLLTTTHIVLLLCVILINLTKMSESVTPGLTPRFALDRLSFGNKVVGGSRGQVRNREQTNLNVRLPEFLTNVFPTQEQKYQNNVNIFMNALLQPGKKLTLKDVSEFLSIFSNVPQNQRELILKANENFKVIREKFSKLNPDGKKNMITSVMRLVNEPRLLTETETTMQIIPLLGGVDKLARAKTLVPSQKQRQVAKGVVGYFEKNEKPSSGEKESPYYFTSVLQKLDTIVNNVLTLLKNEPISIKRNNQIQTLKQQIQQEKTELREKGVTDKLIKLDIKKSWEQTNNADTFQRVMNPYGKPPLQKKDFQKVLTNDGNLNMKLVQKVNQVKRKQQQLRQLQNKQLTSRATQKYYEEKNGKSLQFLKDNKGVIEDLLIRIQMQDGDNKKIMDIIFEKKYKEIIDFFARLTKDLYENGTESEKKQLVQGELKQISQSNYDTLVKALVRLDKAETAAEKVALYHPIFAADYPTELLSLENLLVKLGIPEDVREKIVEKINTYTRELAVYSNKVQLQTKGFLSDVNQYYQIMEKIQALQTQIQTQIQEGKTKVRQTAQRIKQSTQQSLKQLQENLKQLQLKFETKKSEIIKKVIEIRNLFSTFIQDEIINSETLKNMVNDSTETFNLIKNEIMKIKEELLTKATLLEYIPNELMAPNHIFDYFNEKNFEQKVNQILKSFRKNIGKQQSNVLPVLPKDLQYLLNSPPGQVQKGENK